MDATQTKKIMIVDDHAMVRDGLTMRIEMQLDLEVCAEAESVDEAMQLVKQSPPDLMIVDISLKQGNGIDLIKQVLARDDSIKILVCSMFDENLYAERALRAGALGYLNKQESRENVTEAIRTILSGNRYLSRNMMQRMLTQAIAEPSATSSIASLTDRELEVFQLIGQGMTTGAIANQLHLSTHTIDTHREKIKTKLNIKNAAELQREAVQWVLENG